MVICWKVLPRVSTSRARMTHHARNYVGLPQNTALPVTLDHCTCFDFSHVWRQNFAIETLWFAAIKSPKCSALGTTVPVRLLPEALVIFVFKQITQFGVLRKVRLYTVLARTPVPLLLAAPVEVHETNWKCVHSSASGLPEALLKHFHQLNSPWIPEANQASHATYLFVLLRAPLFSWCLVSVESCNGSFRSSSFIPPYIATNALAIFDEKWILTAFPVIRAPNVHRRVSPNKTLREFLEEA